MEFTGDPNELDRTDNIFDMEKLHFINKMGKNWIGADCNKSQFPRKCEELKALSIKYGSDYIFLRRKVEKCEEMFVDGDGVLTNEVAYEKCMESTIKSFGDMIDDYHEKFMARQ
ncbi:hypothetical protein SteCoe_1078 [Stentor coeruleus]|uniref:Uncharacterized protein n=1 Tax=Stentor coeruleus TaxID=5963 RepID=A0A1R2D2J2_9CILI|nr:hypothetical protein SteCoe_1078 [Stentor coeruleus]